MQGHKNKNMGITEILRINIASDNPIDETSFQEGNKTHICN